jgi:hypothetical protein
MIGGLAMAGFTTGDFIALGSLCVAATAWSAQGVFHALGAAGRKAEAGLAIALAASNLDKRLDKLAAGVEGLTARFHDHEIESGEFRGRVTECLEALTQRPLKPGPATRRRRPIIPSDKRAAL